MAKRSVRWTHQVSEGESVGSIAAKMVVAAGEIGGMNVCVSLHYASYGDVTVVHAGRTLGQAHEAARQIPHFEIVQTLIDGWGATVSTGRVRVAAAA
jgi:hypothetical protein